MEPRLPVNPAVSTVHLFPSGSGHPLSDRIASDTTAGLPDTDISSSSVWRVSRDSRPAAAASAGRRFRTC